MAVAMQMPLNFEALLGPRSKVHLSYRACEAFNKVLQARFGGDHTTRTPLDAARQAQQLSGEIAQWADDLLRFHAKMVESRWEYRRRRFFR